MKTWPGERAVMGPIALCAVSIALPVALAAATQPAAAQNAAVSSNPGSSAKTLCAPALAQLQQQVFTAERAFARSRAERDHAAFVRHLSEEALFYSGSVWRQEAPGVVRVVIDKGSPPDPGPP
jgi:hypothetical protein